MITFKDLKQNIIKQKLVVKYEAGTLGFEPKCPIEILKDQKMYMGCYLFKMEVRAEIEGIEL